MIKNIYAPTILVIFLYLAGCSPASEKKNGQADQKATDTLPQELSTKDSIGAIDTATYVVAAEKYLDSIKRNISGLEVIKKDVFGSSAEGGEISIYRSGSDTLKLKAVYYGETGKNEYDLYLRKKKLVLFIERNVFYKSRIGKDPVKIDRTALMSFILDNGKVIRGKKANVVIAKDEYSQKTIDINDIYNEILLQLKE